MNILRTMQTNPDSEIVRLLAALRPAPARQPEQVEKAKALFLDQAAVYLIEFSQLDEKQPRVIGMKNAGLKNLQPVRLFTSLILLVIIALAGTGLALAASQASLPGQALYPLKLWSEDLRLNLAYYSPAGWQLALEFSDQRIREIEAVSQSGGMPPASLLLRLENQSDQAISSALRLDQDQAITAMRMIQERMQSQYLTIEQLQRASPNQPQMEQTLSSVREMIQLRLRQIEQRLQNPAFYNQPSLQVSAQVSPGGALPQPSNVNPVSTPIPGNIPMTTALPAGCISCPVNGTLSPSTAVPGGNQPTQAGSPNPQTTAGSQPNQPGSPLTGENQPGSPPEDSGNPPEKPERPGPGGYRKR